MDQSSFTEFWLRTRVKLGFALGITNCLSSVAFATSAYQTSQANIALFCSIGGFPYLFLVWRLQHFDKEQLHLTDRIFTAVVYSWAPIFAIIRLYEVVHWDSPSQKSEDAAAAIRGASVALSIGRFATGALYGIIGVAPLRAVAYGSLSTVVFAAPPLWSYLMVGEYSWLLAFSQIAIAPTIFGLLFMMYLLEVLLKPTLVWREEALNKRASDRATTTKGPAVPDVFQSIALDSKFSSEYDETRILGHGSSGRAVLLRSRESGRLVVSKQVHIPKSQPDLLKQLVREVHILASLEPHPHIITYATCYQKGDHFCMITEYCPGGTLRDQINIRHEGRSDVPPRSLFPLRVVANWTAQLTSALHAVHSSRVLHRDIKPSNIFLTGDLSVKLGDFGLSRSGLDSSRSRLDNSNGPADFMATTICGTPYYMSSEQAQNQPYSYPTDIWAMGCVVFEVLTLERPFAAKSFPELFTAITSGMFEQQMTLLEECRQKSAAPDPMAEYPRSVLRLITPEGMLNVVPSERMSLAQVGAVLRPLLLPDEQATLAKIPLPPER